MVATHQETTKFLKAPESARVKQLQDLADKVRVLSEERIAWEHQNTTIVQSYQRAVADFNHLRGLHASALNDIAHLQAHSARLEKSNPHQVAHGSGKNPRGSLDSILSCGYVAAILGGNVRPISR